MNQRIELDCARVEELAGAAALGALGPDEQDAVKTHLETCERPHADVRSAAGAGIVLASALEPIEASPALRDRLMASAASTPQEHVSPRVTPRQAVAPTIDRRGRLDWLSPDWARGLAAAAVVAIVALVAWNVTLQAQLAGSQRVTEALADASAVYQVTGEAGRGLLIDTPDGPRFLATGMEPAPAGSLYELWLIGEDGVPVDVGIVEPGDGVAVVPIDLDLAGYTTFAVTVETSRVEAPTSDPVLTASIGDDGSSS